MERVLEVRDLSVRFGRTVILHVLSFSVERGHALAILGPNAAGKTVLFRALIGAIPYDGIIRWADGTRIGYVPQKLDLERDVPMTGVDFLRARAALVPRPVNSRTRARQDRNATVFRALELVGVSRSAANQPIGTLSGGQFQRLLVAFALVGDPNVLLLDEPTAGVDEPGQERLNELVRRLQQEQGLTVLFISHELSVVYRYATDVLCLSRDRVCVGPPKTVLTPDLLHEMYGSPLDYHVHDH
jgi:zinc transport system ATP-binding protein